MRYFSSRMTHQWKKIPSLFLTCFTNNDNPFNLTKKGIASCEEKKSFCFSVHNNFFVQT
jgi:hypothetical protein